MARSRATTPAPTARGRCMCSRWATGGPAAELHVAVQPGLGGPAGRRRRASRRLPHARRGRFGDWASGCARVRRAVQRRGRALLLPLALLPRAERHPVRDRHATARALPSTSRSRPSASASPCRRSSRPPRGDRGRAEAAGLRRKRPPRRPADPAMMPDTPTCQRTERRRAGGYITENSLPGRASRTDGNPRELVGRLDRAVRLDRIRRPLGRSGDVCPVGVLVHERVELGGVVRGSS